LPADNGLVAKDDRFLRVVDAQPRFNALDDLAGMPSKELAL
jgi:hypothetical protein